MVKSGSHFDVIVYGSNLTGVLLAHQFSKANYKVLLLEETDDVGRSHYAEGPEGELFHSSLELVPDLESSNESIAWLEQLMNQSVIGNSFEQSPVTFRDAKFRDFVGFGDLKFESADDLHWYSQAKVRHLTSSPQDWMKTILDEPSFQVSCLSKISQFIIEDNRVKSIKVNSTKTLTADHYFFCETPFYLDRVLSEKKAITAKERSRFAKMEGWTEVSLQLLHRGFVTDNFSSHILFGGKADFEPAVGRFFPVESDSDSDQTVQGSTWVCLIPADMAEDIEYVGATLRNVKKQIKRAYPEALSEGTQERIQVYPSAIGTSESA
ncbi:MAG: hypothetical protein HRT45_09465, partial [Bdellovibrionales bacterium]|nr:hypothetical protein [Bdellovibrionales bacterium]